MRNEGLQMRSRYVLGEEGEGCRVVGRKLVRLWNDGI